MEILTTIFKIIGLMLLADFTTGIVHFWMDQYGKEDMPFVGKHVIEINLLHHSNPRNMVQKTYWKLTWTSWLLGFIILGSLLAFGIFRWEICFILVYGANANIIHKWTHQTAKENGKLIGLLQKTRLLQSKKHHGWHHNAPFDTNYCILTDWLNPVLHRIRFWEGIVWFFKKLGFHPVAGTFIRKFV